MATGVVKVTVVDVGQGQCTFVEIYNTDSTPKLIHALLFDCGSDKKSDETSTNLQYIATKVAGMDTPAFDTIFFSHSDKDHISLTYDLLQEFPSSKKPTVKQVWYGGARSRYTKYDFNILDYLEEEGYCTKSNLKTTGSNYTGYDTTSKSFTQYLWRSADNSVAVYAIVSNVLSDDPDWDENDLDVEGKTAEALNRVSMVCWLSYTGASYVICGDATNKTMGAINTLFTAGTTVFNKNNMTTLPHHGSRATGFAVKSSEVASSTAKQVVSDFAGLLKSKTLTISSFEKHRHPSLELMNAFPPTITTPFVRDPRLKETNAHRLIGNVDIALTQPKGWSLLKTYYSFDTTSCMFSTRYSQLMTCFSYNLGASSVAVAKGPTSSSVAINAFACWQYETQTNGNFLLGGYANLALPLVLFTAGTTSMVASQPNPAIASVRVKDQSKKVRQPAHTQSQFYDQLKQFR